MKVGVGAWASDRGKGGYQGKADAKARKEKEYFEGLGKSFGKGPAADEARKELANQVEEKSLPTFKKINVKSRRAMGPADSMISGLLASTPAGLNRDMYKALEESRAQREGTRMKKIESIKEKQRARDKETGGVRFFSKKKGFLDASGGLKKDKKQTSDQLNKANRMVRSIEEDRHDLSDTIAAITAQRAITTDPIARNQANAEIQDLERRRRNAKKAIGKLRNRADTLKGDLDSIKEKPAGDKGGDKKEKGKK
jgi:hypothetical protein